MLSEAGELARGAYCMAYRLVSDDDRKYKSLPLEIYPAPMAVGGQHTRRTHLW